MSKWQEIAIGRRGHGYKQAVEANVPWVWIRPVERSLHELNAELRARKKADEEAKERARNCQANPQLRTKAEVAGAAAARAETEETRMLMQARTNRDERMAAQTGRAPLTATEHALRIAALGKKS